MHANELDKTIAALAAMPDELARTVDRIGEPRAGVVPAPGSFSLVEHVWHLAEIESEAYAVRLRRLREEVEPLLADFDGSRLADERAYRQRDLREGLAAFARCRASNVATLKAIASTEWTRGGTQECIGPIRLADVPRMMAEHDATHRAELDELARSIEQHSGEVQR